MTDAIQIKHISALDTFKVRHPVLRIGRPIEDCKFIGDNLKTTFHLGAFKNDALTGVTTLMKNKQPLFDSKNQYQLRGMAILTAFQNNGIGKLLIDKGVQYLKTLNIDLIWCNARIIAVPFYQKNGFQTIGDPFDVPKIGLHYVMFKNISSD